MDIDLNELERMANLMADWAEQSAESGNNLMAHIYSHRANSLFDSLDELRGRK